MYGLPKKAAKPAEPVNDQDERRIWETPDNKTGGGRGGISQGKERPVGLRAARKSRAHVREPAFQASGV